MSRAHALITHVIRPVSEALGGPHPLLEDVLFSAASLREFDPWHAAEPGTLGLFGITPELHRQVWDQYLAYRPEQASRVRGYASQHRFLEAPDDELITNTCYAAAVGISALQWVRSTWPPVSDVAGVTRLWAELTSIQGHQKVVRFEELLSHQLASHSENSHQQAVLTG
ncbi:hypothetical protein CF392_04155 [Tamilnaduibacter salinus]|uniref:Uncharacterized protein n=1 Tax=Tamilnaduibacter salinus TaxID=1484056 RepID=A0A2A2I6U9_9GAMM|nr:hypothetical protein [Tamilnaduibacter salinus]PAV26763.1 hypothetical protein CF392_04155 [Tamilnaduibacter salinus]